MKELGIIRTGKLSELAVELELVKASNSTLSAAEVVRT
jgi:hypothetical protein